MRVLFLILMIWYSYCINAQIFINEFLSSNVNGIVDEDNEYSDWIEIYNSGSVPIDIVGYALSDEILITDKWTFPEYSFNSGEYLLVFASGKDRKEIGLTYQTLIDWGDTWKYIVPDSEIGTGWRYAGYDASSWNTGSSGFGYEDGDDNTVIPTTLSVFIRKEFDITDLSSIQKLILHIDYDDGFVAYVNGHEIARMNLGNPGEEIPFDQGTNDLLHEAEMYQGGSPEYHEITDPQTILVEGTNAIAIQGHNVSLTSSDMSLIPFLSVGRFGSGHTEQISPYLSFPNEGLHTNFKLKADGESFYLFDPLGVLVDSVGATLLLSDVSYGRKPDGTENWFYFGEPTPKGPNNTEGVDQQTGDTVVFSVIGGKHLGGTTVSLSSSDPSDPIYYTLDGSIPGSDDNLYTVPLQINTSAVLRARVLDPLSLPGPVVTNTYATELDHDFPIICVSTEPDNLWDEFTGIYVLGPNAEPDYPYFGANFWQDWEKPVHFELYDVSGEKKIDQGAGAKIFGGWSRGSDQKSMSLFARSQYGKGSFEYKFFADKPIEKFEALVLRNSGNDNMGLQFHDGFMTGLTSKMNTDRQAFQPSVFYLNGEYWGILNIREKVNEHFVAENHHVDPASVNLLENAGDIIFGDNTDYLEIINYLNSHSSLYDNSVYAWVADKIDIDNFIQYQLTQIYINNRDWPGNNIKFWNTGSVESKWRWILFDTDFGYGIWDVNDYALNTLEFALEPNGSGWPNPSWSTLFLRRMVTNIGFRYNFINQYCDRLNLDFSPSVAIAQLDSLKDLFGSEIVYHFNRWWGSYNNWSSKIEDKKTFALRRPDYSRAHMQSVFNLGNELQITIDVSDSDAGKVRLNSIYPKDYPFSGIYFEDVPIRMTAIPKEGYKFVRWEGTLNSTSISINYDMSAGGSFTAVFEEAGSSDISVVINEINYNSAPNLDTKDWIEIVNNGQATVNLNGWLLSDTGPDDGYYFPSMTMAPNDYLVICRDLEAFRTYYPNRQNSVGDMPFGLSSNGDMIRLYDDEGYLMDAVDYYIYSPWPENANGTGATIELIHPSSDNTKGENWQAVGIGGTPCEPNTGVLYHEEPKIPDPLTSSFECFPNPFRDFTTIQFNVYLDGNYRLEIFDINGRLVDVLVDEYLTGGTYYIDWYGNNQYNEHSGNGIYTVRLSDKNNVETIKLLILK
ncbi:MAG: CotH kinase family protein [Bacteroidales bacterium]|nr:CotH kinase family protein [Bacteroidales bacterium]